MGSVHTKRSVVILDGTEISRFCNTVTWPKETDSHENTTFGQDSKTYVSGLHDGKVTIGGPYDTAAAGPNTLIQDIQDAGDAVTVVYRVEGTGSGLPQKSASVIVTSYNESAAVADIVQWTAELQISGDVDRTPQ